MLWTVPRLWGGETCFVVGGGASLRGFDPARLAGRRVIAINYTGIVPDADYLAASDGGQYRVNGMPFWPGRSVTIAEDAPAGWLKLRNTGEFGIETWPQGARGSRTSLHLGINLAYHLGAARIVILGADMGPSSDGVTHWDGSTNPSYFDPDLVSLCYRPALESCVRPLAQAGITVLDATPGAPLGLWSSVCLEDLA